MKRLFTVILLTGYLLLSGCSSPLSDVTSPDTKIPQAEPSTSNGTSTDTDQPSTFLRNMPGTKKIVPKTSADGFSLEYITYPELSDQSANHITKEFVDLEGLFKYNILSPICFLDNENFLFSARKTEELNENVYRYNLKTKALKELFQDPRSSKTPDLFILNSAHFVIGYDKASFFIDNDRVSKEILLESLQEKYKEYDIPQIAVNPETGKVILLDYSKKRCYLTDLNTEEIVELPFQGVYRVCWIDDETLFLGTFNKIDRYVEGSAIVTYNIRTKATTKTYLGEYEVFGNSYRSGDKYYGFNFLIDYFGSPHGTIGVIDYTEKKILFLELENAVDDLSLRNNWVVAVVADKPVDWKVWGRTVKDTVLLCVYDVATESYTIRAKNLPKPSMGVSTSSMIISPDGKTIIYQSEDKAYINQAE